MYSNEKWKKFSKIMIEKLGAECSKCFTREDHVILQIIYKFETEKLSGDSIIANFYLNELLANT